MSGNVRVAVGSFSASSVNSMQMESVEQKVLPSRSLTHVVSSCAPRQQNRSVPHLSQLISNAGEYDKRPPPCSRDKMCKVDSHE